MLSVTNARHRRRMEHTAMGKSIMPKSILIRAASACLVWFCSCLLLPSIGSSDPMLRTPSNVSQLQHQLSVPAGPYSVVNTASGALITTIPICGWKTRGGMSINMVVTRDSKDGSQFAGDLTEGWHHSLSSYVVKWPSTNNVWQWCNTDFVRLWKDTMTTRCPGNPDDLAAGSTGFVVTAKNQTTYEFQQLYSNPTNFYFLSRSKDTYGNAISYSYESGYPALVHAVTDPSGRALTFTWEHPQGPPVPVDRLKSVTDPRGKIYTFLYGDSTHIRHLTRIDFPATEDGPAPWVEFTYETGTNGDRIKTIKTPGNNGSGTLTWTYTYYNAGDPDISSGLVGYIRDVTGPNAGDSSTGKVSFTYKQNYLASDSRLYLRTDVRDAQYSSGSAHRQVHLYYPDDGDDRSFSFFGPMIAYNISSTSSNDSAGSSYDSVMTTDFPGCEYSKYEWNRGTNVWYASLFDGTIARYTNPRGKSWTYQWSSGSTTDNRLNLWKITDPDSYHTDFEYNAANLTNKFARLSMQTDPVAGHVTTYTYNNQYKPLSVAQKYDGSNALTTTSDYDSYGNLNSTTDPYGNQTTFSYDASTYYSYVKTQADVGTGVFSEFTYDAMGNQLSSTAPRRFGETVLTTNYTYDAINRLYTITYPGSKTTHWTYDANGNKLKVYDENSTGSATLAYNYDNYSNCDSATTWASVGTSANQAVTTTFQYNNLGQRLWTKWYRGTQKTINYYYDERGRLKQESLPGSKPGWAKYHYDLDGNVISREEGPNTSRTLKYSYDNLDRPDQDLRSDGTTVLVDRTYTNDGLLSNITYNPQGISVSYTYDAAHRMTMSYQSLANKSVHYTYSTPPTNTTTVTLQDGMSGSVRGSYTYQYGVGGRLDSLISPPSPLGGGNGPTAQYTYGPFGLVSQITYDVRLSGSPYTKYIYDSFDKQRLWLSRLSNCRSDGSTISDFTYSYDLVGNITKIVEPAMPGQPSGDYTLYTYDGSYRLLSEDRRSPTASSWDRIYNYAYEYDEVGNRTKKTLRNNAYPNGTIWTSSYSDNNLLDSVYGSPSAGYVYDNFGRLTSRDASQDWTYAYAGEYSDLDLMTSATSNGQTTSFRYDPLKRRVEKTAGSTITRYVYDGDELIAEIDTSGNVLVWYTPGICESRWNGTTSAWDTYYYMTDHQGSTRQVVDKLQRVVDAYSYNAYGEELGHMMSGASAPKNPRRYVGKAGYYTDDETGLDLLGVRYYDPFIGRFITQDPDRDGLNWYAYADNNPVNRVDPDGQDSAAAAEIFKWGSVAAGSTLVVPVAGEITAPAIETVALVAAGSVVVFETVEKFGPRIVEGAKSAYSKVSCHFAKPSKRANQKEGKGRSKVEVPRVSDAARDIQKPGEKMSDAVNRLKTDPKYKGKLKNDEISATRKWWDRKGN